MSNALIPIQQKTVIFYEDEITAVLVDTPEGQQVYIPIRPLCEFLGIDWSAQRKRITGDPVLSGAVSSVAVSATEAGGRREMLCLPLDYLNGWVRLFTCMLIAV